MNLKYFIFLTTMILIGTVNAEIIISPNPINIDVRTEIPEQFNITITNNFDFTIMDLSFKDLPGFTFPTNMTIESNETKKIDFTVDINEITFKEILSEVSFRYEVEIPLDPEEHEIEITSSGFKPSYIPIYEGDRIKWINKDHLERSVTSSMFDYNMLPNATATHTFPTIGIINYQDFYGLFGGTVEVLNKNQIQKVNNPSYNKILKVNLNAMSDPTNLSINILSEKQITVEATGSKSGSISIKNIGEETAHGIELSSNNGWAKFIGNNLAIEPGETEYITFTINPLIFSKNETDKNHTVEINIKGLNTDQYNETIRVFVPYSDKLDDLNSEEGFLTWFAQVYCPSNPNSFLCNTSATGGSGQIIIRDPEVPINLTASQFYALIKRQQTMEQTQQRDSNRLTQLADNLESSEKQQLNMLNQSLQMNIKANDQAKMTARIFWITMIIGTILIGFLVCWYYFAKWRYKRQLTGGWKQ